MKKTVLFFVFIMFVWQAYSQTFSIIPAPVSIHAENGSFSLTPDTRLIVDDKADSLTAGFLNSYLQRYYGFTIKQSTGVNENFIKLATKKFVTKAAEEGHYSINVFPKGIDISGDSYMGTFYGMQTLLQLLPVTRQNTLSIPAVSIDDYPRFAYRGMHLDVSRHFFNIDFIKKYIDFIALHKMNTFHWHLTDDQGWRIEIKKYPKLTSVGGFRNGTIIGRYPGKGNDNLRYGGFYTQQEIKEIIKYAADRFITVIPEIELPGHSSAAIAAYPELSCFPNESTMVPAQAAWAGSTEGKQVQQTWGVFPDVYCPTENTFAFLEGVLDEVINLFPAEFIHVGGDECPKDYWKRSAFCQQLIKEKGLKDEHGLQSYFIQRIEKYINSKGKKIIGWDEILEGGLAPNATVMSWQGEKGGIEAARQDHNVIMTPESHVYLNYAQSKNEDSITIGNFTPLEKVYSYEPLPKELDLLKTKYVLGAQANLWTEYIGNPSLAEYQLFPRISALSEVLWSQKNRKNYTDFENKLPTQLKRYDLWKTNYSTAYYDVQSIIRPTHNFKGISWTLETKSNGGIFVTDTEKNTGIKYTEPVIINGSAKMEATAINDGKVVSVKKSNFSFNKATGKKITLTDPASSTYPGLEGAFGLVNGLKSEKDFLSREWLGWFNKNMEAVIDLGEAQEVSKVSVDCWRQEPSFIYLPKSVEIFTSTDGTNWINKTSSITNGKWEDNRKAIVTFNEKVKARYVKVVAIKNGIIAEGKPGAGRASWLFADEIEIE